LGSIDEGAVLQLRQSRRDEGDRPGVFVPAGHDGNRHVKRWQHVPGAAVGRATKDGGLGGRSASQRDPTVGPLDESTPDVGLERVGVQLVQGRLRREVGNRLFEGGE
jgi:hypothetical protein